MKILISGATGLVGSELGKKLAGQGHEIVVLTRNPEKAQKTCPFPHQALSWSDLDSSEETKDLDAIIHLAGAGIFDKRWTASFKEQIRSSRVDTTESLVTLANRTPSIKAFVSTSAVGIYGEADDKPVLEDNPQSYSFLGKVCQEWEEPVQKIKSARAVILRVGIVLSDKGGALEKMVPPIQAGFGGPLASGKQWMSWIDVDDLVDMYDFALNQNISGVFNAVAPNPVQNKTLTQVIAKHLGKSAFLPAPYPALRLVLGEVAPHLIESQTISSHKIEKAGFQFKYPEVKASVEKRVPKLSGHEKRFIFEQWVPRPREEVFDFFSEAKNLEQITPDSLNFKILDTSTEGIEKGTVINYKLKIDGIPIRWRTLITEWDPPHHFADNQEKGPYSKWYHVHRFEELAAL